MWQTGLAVLMALVMCEAVRAQQKGEESLDSIIEALKVSDLSYAQIYKPLTALRRVPVDPKRRAEVAALLDPVLAAENSTVRRAAQEAMKSWGTELNLPTLIKQLSVPDSSERAGAIAVLGAIGGKDAAKAVAARLGDKDDGSNAEQALEKIGSAAEEYVWPYLTSGDTITHGRACHLLAKIGTSKSLVKLKARHRESDGWRRAGVEIAIRDLEKRLVKR
jgi:hypothetical protein